jgi:hypothetical protein
MSTSVPGYRLIMASSVGERDGFAIELLTADGKTVAEVFEDHATKARTFRQLADTSIPIEAVEWLLETARSSLSPNVRTCRRE